MYGLRGRCEPRSGLSGSDPPPRRQNRLSRSFRQTQTPNQNQTQVEATPWNHKSEFKSPTRIPRSRGPGFSGESPHNDSDIQQDIIWDASPTPQRLGKRGKKHPVGVVDISEIVSRIAPEHGRPKVTEPTLQQWIGDSAAIPCTPDVQVPKPKKKSPRLNGVDDLLKLAKQFDFNMFHQDEQEEREERDEEEALQQSPELLSDAIFDDDVPLSLPRTCRQAAPTADLEMDDDLDFLFDGPTQRLSGDLSQLSSSLTSRGKRVASAGDTLEKPAPLPPPHGKVATVVKDEFEDDWENDDLLNDSLVLEMTQNPLKFSAPRFCSTQRQTPNKRLSRSAASEEEKENVRTTFKLTSNPDFSVERTRTNAHVESLLGHSSEPAKAANRQTKSNLPFHQRAPAAGAKLTAAAVKNAQNSAEKPTPAADFLDEDLDFFFSADPVWDDPADDHLLCEMCDDLENELALQPANQQPASERGGATAQQTPLVRGSGAASVRVDAAKDSFRFTRPASSSGAATGCRSQSAAAAPPPSSNNGKTKFTFKKPNNPVPMVTNTAALSKCSAAEIELKKQQAMQRRRQRLQAIQNLQTKT